MKSAMILTMLLHVVATSYSQDQGSTVIRTVRVEEFKQAMDSLNDEVVIDLRTPEETGKGKIPGAIEIDFLGSGFESALAGLDKNKPYLLYCAGGVRSVKAMDRMRKLGFRKIYNLESGYNGWVKRKMPVQ